MSAKTGKCDNCGTDLSICLNELGECLVCGAIWCSQCERYTDPEGWHEDADYCKECAESKGARVGRNEGHE